MKGYLLNLSDELHRDLKAISERTGIPMSEALRRMAQAYTCSQLSGTIVFGIQLATSSGVIWVGK